MTELLFRSDPYLRQAPARVVEVTAEGGLVLDRCLYYPTGGGQPGDIGWLDWEHGRIAIATTVKGQGGAVVLVPEPGDLPPAGAEVMQRLDWDRRYRHMRMHTALHLLSVVLPHRVVGGQIGAGRGRLDFLMEAAPEHPGGIEADLAAYVRADLPVTEDWITEAELDANPGLVKTLAVAPPRGQGGIRLIRIGTPEDEVDLQPCGGTHVARTGEIGRLRLGKIENKGRQNRRVPLIFAD